MHPASRTRPHGRERRQIEGLAVAKSIVPPPAKTLVSLQVAADRLGWSVRTVRRRISEGALTSYRVGPQQLRVDLSEVDALLLGHVVPTLLHAR